MSFASPTLPRPSSGSHLNIPANPFDHVPSFSLDGPPPVSHRVPAVVGDVPQRRYQHLYILPVLLLEFLALALTRAVLPAILLEHYGNSVYMVLGCADCVRGLLAFVASPLFGKISDIVGRRLCLLVTVMGTCAPVCSLALFPWEHNTTTGFDVGLNNSSRHDNHLADMYNASTINDIEQDSDSSQHFWAMQSFASSPPETIHHRAITTFIILLALSGIFSCTFALVFAYISDTVRQQDERVAAYGLALATFGLSFTIGPMAGGYLARSNTHHVFLCSLFLSILDLLYIYFILPESKQIRGEPPTLSSTISLISMDNEFTWSPTDTLRIIAVDPFLRRVGEVAFLYYTGLWAIVSTLSVYAVKRFHLGPERLGELMSALGLCTMVAEAVLVRIVVPLLGEKKAMRLGLAVFAVQCVLLGLAYEGWHLFVCTALSLVANLVYPSLSSLVSGSVAPDAVGEALGAVNGIKSLTEGIGPLVFGSLMTISEQSALPGWPYILAAGLVFGAYIVSDGLPETDDDYYIHELERKKFRQRSLKDQAEDTTGIALQLFLSPSPAPTKMWRRVTSLSQASGDQDDDQQGLLSDVDESEEDGVSSANDGDLTRLPITFASLVNLPPP